MPSISFERLGAALLLSGSVVAAAQSDIASPEYAAEYLADRPKTVVELQQFRRAVSVPIELAPGQRGNVTLTDLQPRIHRWFILEIAGTGSEQRKSYHLENPAGIARRIRLDEAQRRGITIESRERSSMCELWSGGSSSALEQARRTALPYAPLCDGSLYLRNPAAGRYTQLERISGLLREHVRGGERIVGFVREELFRDAHLERAPPGPAVDEADPGSPDAPEPGRVRAAVAGRTIVPAHRGIEVDAPTRHFVPGRWYRVKAQPSVHLSVIEPGQVSGEFLDSFRGTVNVLDGIESGALVSIVAFDLAALEVEFATGTEHPKVDWSPRALAAVRLGQLPGPDGVASIAPLVGNGMVSPPRLGRTIATFTGGFKREHGAFQYGALAMRNRGSHYGFIESGVVLSKLHPGLATLVVMDDGSVELKTWAAQDERALARIKHARQNGVPLIDHDPATGRSSPGALVTQWGPGNWSGSTEGHLRALRAGICLQVTPSKRFLLYGYFSSATPSAMVRVFQAYGCRYAMHLDMNALEHTYLALYGRKGDQVTVQHLIDGMSVLDRKTRSGLAPRFMGIPDNRDFFYLVNREQAR